MKEALLWQDFSLEKKFHQRFTIWFDVTLREAECCTALACKISGSEEAFAEKNE